jgi:hypothetical protein
MTLLALGLLAACETTPDIKGPTRFVVGQRVTLELEVGDAFVDGELTLVDAAGREYTASDPDLEYDFDSESLIRFTVPHGIASGTALVTVGTTGAEPYEFEVEIVRLYGVLNVSGTLAFYGLEGGDQQYSSYTVGTGPGFLSLSAAGDRLLAVAASEGELHFLELTTNSLEPYAPSVSLGIPLGRGALLDRGAVVASEQGVGYIGQLPDGSLVLDTWLETGAVTAVAAAPKSNRAVAVGTSGDATGQVNVMYRINANLQPPALVDNDGVVIGGTLDGVFDVAMTPDGVVGIAVNGLDGNLIGVVFENDPPVPTTTPLPAEDLGCTRLVAEADSQWLAVLCEESRTVSIFSVLNGGFTHSVSAPVDPRAVETHLQQVPVDAGFAPGGVLYVLLTDGAVSRVDPSTDPPTVTMLRQAQSNPGTALLVQP